MKLTRTVLVRLLQEKGITARRSLGQHFLIDPNFLNYLIRTARITHQDFILEIGSGPGWFTSLLAEKGRYVWGVEIDRKLFDLSRELFGSRPNISFINANILDKKSGRLNPVVVRQIKEKTSGSSRKPLSLKVIGNLPFRCAEAIILALLESNLFGHQTDLRFDTMSLLIQREMASRLVAKPARADYRALTVLVQILSEVKVIREIPPEVFLPRPKVTSTLVNITPKSLGPPSVVKSAVYPALKRLVKALFQYRRKTIGRTLKALNLMPGIESVLEKNGLSPALRPEEIPPQAYLALVKKLTKNLY